ncbi:MAG: signal peptidase II [Elusimicrobia bacterium CG_4_10_14_3_um_filter_49_12_50_7]|nr:MAG: signal peptidase II [Elusimicrobia bacterium CG_4_8_14_3_um_filter_50_9]PIY16795.1 MAG: signal peptidase II [Elusimicrobia bacterium CG_4_10_14_3_um_filter_49_12_50_7]
MLKPLSKKTFIFVALAGFVLDRLSKFVIRENFWLGEYRAVLGNFFRLTRISNTGIAFGMARGNNLFFLALSLIILAMMLYFFVQKADEHELLPLTLIISGAAGNIYDRVFYGSVCDFLEFNLGFAPFNPWPIFNIADSMVVAGGIILFYIEFIRKKT